MLFGSLSIVGVKKGSIINVGVTNIYYRTFLYTISQPPWRLFYTISQPPRGLFYPISQPPRMLFYTISQPPRALFYPISQPPRALFLHNKRTALEAFLHNKSTALAAVLDRLRLADLFAVCMALRRIGAVSGTLTSAKEERIER